MHNENTGREERKEQKKIFEIILEENSPELHQTTNPKISVYANRIKASKSTPKHIIFKWQKTRPKENLQRNLEGGEETPILSIRSYLSGNVGKNYIDLYLETTQAKRCVVTYLKHRKNINETVNLEFCIQ